MRQETRFKFNAYLSRVAELNGIDAGDVSKKFTVESDTDYRLRIQQAFEGLSVAGSVGAYQYHGRSADGRVADISVTSPSPACVTISVLSRENNGVASEDLLAVVRNALNGEDVRPVADRVTVQSAAIVEYQINATLYLYPGPESEPIRAAAVKKLEAYITAQHRLGRDIRLSAIYAALHVEGVQRVELTAPLADIVLNSTQASFCTEYSVVTGGSDGGGVGYASMPHMRVQVAISLTRQKSVITSART